MFSAKFRIKEKYLIVRIFSKASNAKKEARTSPNILIIGCRKPNDIQYVNFCFHSRFKQCQKRKTKPPLELVE